MSNTNFLQFDVNQQNMLNDTEYNSDAQRISGVSEGIARSQLYNKTLFQSSTMVKALADLMVDGGQNVMDNNLTALKQTIKNSFITAWSDNIFSGDNTFSGSVSLNGTISASQAVKQSIVGWGMPDFDSGVAITSPYTPTVDGIIVAHKSSGYSTAEIKLTDGNIVARHQSADSSSSNNYIWAFAKSGKSYTMNGTSTFYPFIGA